MTDTERINKVCDTLECDITDLYDDEILKDVRRMHEAASINTMLSEDSELEEIELIQNIQGIYDVQGITGILKLMDRMIYYVGVDKALEIVKRHQDESD